MCLPSNALLQHLPSYLGFSYLGRGVSLHGCSSKAQLLLLTLEKWYLLTTALPDLQRGIAPLRPSCACAGTPRWTWGCSWLFFTALHGCSSKAQPLLPTLDEGYLLTTAPPDLEHGVALLLNFFFSFCLT